MPERRGLVLVRCGDRSLHSNFVSDSRSWDLAISYYGADAERQFPDARYVHRLKGGKWDGLFNFFKVYPEALERYDYFWLPDDDIAATSRDVDLLFDLMRRYNFELAQPSLSQDSYLSHLITLTNPAFAFRYTNFVELMAPILSRTMLKKILPLFAQTRSGFGIDFVWQRFVGDPLREVAIIDDVVVRHTRPVGGALHNMITSEGFMSARQEQDVFLAPYGDVVKIESTLGGKLKNGRMITQRHVAACAAALGWSSKPSGNRGFTGPITAMQFLRWVLRHLYFSLCTAPQIDKIEPIYNPSPKQDHAPKIALCNTGGR